MSAKTKTTTAPVEVAKPVETNNAEATVLPMATDGAAILALDDRRVEMVAVPEWGMRVTIQSLTGDERDAVDAWIEDHRDEAGDVKQRGFKTLMVAVSAVDPAGRLLFTPEQAAELGRKNWKAIDRLATVALELSKLTQQAVDDATDELGKAQSDASGTA